MRSFVPFDLVQTLSFQIVIAREFDIVASHRYLRNIQDSNFDALDDC